MHHVSWDRVQAPKICMKMKLTFVEKWLRQNQIKAKQRHSSDRTKTSPITVATSVIVAKIFLFPFSLFPLLFPFSPFFPFWREKRKKEERRERKKERKETLLQGLTWPLFEKDFENLTHLYFLKNLWEKWRDEIRSSVRGPTIPGAFTRGNWTKDWIHAFYFA
jgi:hypothetical protein